MLGWGLLLSECEQRSADGEWPGSQLGLGGLQLTVGRNCPKGNESSYKPLSIQGSAARNARKGYNLGGANVSSQEVFLDPLTIHLERRFCFIDQRLASHLCHSQGFLPMLVLNSLTQQEPAMPSWPYNAMPRITVQYKGLSLSWRPLTRQPSTRWQNPQVGWTEKSWQSAPSHLLSKSDE